QTGGSPVETENRARRSELISDLDGAGQAEHLYLGDSHRTLRARGPPMNKKHFSLIVAGATFLLFAISSTGSLSAQEPQGPQAEAPPPVAVKPAPTPRAGAGEKVIVPAGTRVGVVLQNGISTRSAKPGDSVYLETSFPITIANRIVIPVGSYLRGELLESRRPVRIKGRLQLCMHLHSLILPSDSILC